VHNVILRRVYATIVAVENAMNIKQPACIFVTIRANVEWNTENTVQLIEMIRINKSIPKT
jgi:hypothetical protein